MTFFGKNSAASVRSGFRGFTEQAELERRRRRRQRKDWMVAISIWLGAAGVGTAYGAGWLNKLATPAATLMRRPTRTQFSLCVWGGGQNCVVDGEHNLA